MKNTFSEMHSHVLDKNTTNDNATTGDDAKINDEGITINGKVVDTPLTFKLWIIPFHWNFSQYIPAHLP